ncbi:Conserved_hypothetical protein [Hexamita inflata]|uniref:NSFL1 cofactor p47 n=1 Tax=Hexamita inflata TaxID=28002 RepID=A0AA86PZM2_9EUKA|nr:Conserved hypothetical protein [Hexamita inflata]
MSNIRALIEQFRSITDTNEATARNYLEMSNNSLDMAISLFYESDQQIVDIPDEPYVPPQQKIPETKPAPIQPKPIPVQSQSKPIAPLPIVPEEKKGFFGIKKEVSQPPSQKQDASNYHQFKPSNTAGEQLFNDGGVKEGGSGTALYRPKADFDLKIDVFLNGFVMNGLFFSFDEEINNTYLKELMTTKVVPEALFSKFPANQRPQKNQTINASLDQHQTDYSKAAEEKKEKQQTFDSNEKGRSIGPKVTQTPSGTVNFTMRDTGENGVMIKVKADQTFVVKCSRNHTLHDLMIGIIQNGGQLEPFRCVFKLQSGQEFDMGMTVEQANVIQKCVLAVHK